MSFSFSASWAAEAKKGGRREPRPRADPWSQVHPDPFGVSNGTRTRDILDHNQVLYQLSYTHHAPNKLLFG